MITKQKKPNTVMMTKKNYKEAEHFEQFYTVVLPASNGRKCTLYYRRHNPSKKNVEGGKINIYDLIHNKNNVKAEVSNENREDQLPIDRTLEVVTFDDNVNLDIAKQIFKKLGKIRKFIPGEGNYKGKSMYFIMIVYKF
jgi:hypothetical protein